MNLGRDQPNNFFGLGQDRPRRAGWASIGLAQHGKPSEGSPARGRINFLPPARLLHATCRRRKKVNEKNEKEKSRGRRRTWRGGGGRWWRCGGVARGRRPREAALRREVSSSSPFFPSVLSSVGLVFLVFGFDFICFRFIATLPSISFVLSLSSVSSPSLPSGLFPPYRKKNMEQVCFSCVPSITQRLVGHSVVVGARRERERRGIFFKKNFRLLFC